jgi:hypothetical protein
MSLLSRVTAPEERNDLLRSFAARRMSRRAQSKAYLGASSPQHRVPELATIEQSLTSLTRLILPRSYTAFPPLSARARLPLLPRQRSPRAGCAPGMGWPAMVRKPGALLRRRIEMMVASS